MTKQSSSGEGAVLMFFLVFGAFVGLLLGLGNALLHDETWKVVVGKGLTGVAAGMGVGLFALILLGPGD